MTEEHNNQLAQLAQLVNYLLESEDWKKVYLSEVSEPVNKNEPHPIYKIVLIKISLNVLLKNDVSFI